MRGTLRARPLDPSPERAAAAAITATTPTAIRHVIAWIVLDEHERDRGREQQHRDHQTDDARCAAPHQAVRGRSDSQDQASDHAEPLGNSRQRDVDREDDRRDREHQRPGCPKSMPTHHAHIPFTVTDHLSRQSPVITSLR